MAVDPVCGMTVDPSKAAGQFDYNGTTYYFCSKGCLAKFAADPKKYLSGLRDAMPAPALLTIGGLKRKGAVPLFPEAGPAKKGYDPFSIESAPAANERGGAAEWTC